MNPEDENDEEYLQDLFGRDPLDVDYEPDMDNPEVIQALWLEADQREEYE